MERLKKLITEGTQLLEDNSQVISDFVSGAENPAKTPNLFVEPLKGRGRMQARVLMNYATPIALITSQGTVYVNMDNYSASTTKIQRQVKAAALGAKETDEDAITKLIDKEQ